MTSREFAARLSHHGSDFSKWPAPQARAARALLIGSPACQRHYLRALEGDATLAAAVLPQVGADRLAANLCAQLARTPQRPAGWSRQAALRSVSLAACVLLGMLAGWYSAAAPHAAPLLYAAVDLTPFTGSGE